MRWTPPSSHTPVPSPGLCSTPRSSLLRPPGSLFKARVTGGIGPMPGGCPFSSGPHLSSSPSSGGALCCRMNPSSPWGWGLLLSSHPRWPRHPLAPSPTSELLSLLWMPMSLSLGLPMAGHVPRALHHQSGTLDPRGGTSGQTSSSAMS